MNYFNYAIKCVIRNVIYKLMKPRNLAIIIVSLIVIFLLSTYTTVFGWEGDDTYTDKNNTIIQQYDSINQDILNRLNYYDKTNNMYLEFISYLKNNNYSYYAYYGASDGSSMVSSSYYGIQEIFIKFYDNVDKQISGTAFNLYQGMDTNIVTVTGGIVETFCFSGNTLVNLDNTSSFYIPTVLLNYKSPVLYTLLNDTSSSQTNDIVGAINNQTNSINQQTNTIEQQTTVIQETQDFISDDSITTSNMTVDTTGMSVSDSNNIFGFLTNFLTNLKNFYNNINDDVQTIEIPMPYNMDSIYIRSDIVSSRISGTFLYTLIQTLWYFVFGTYLLFYVKHLINFFSTGEFATTGLAHFLEHLENEDVIIRSTMM